MSKIKKIISIITFILIIGMPVNTMATEFDDTYCEKTFDGETLWTSNIKSGKFYGQKLDASSGVYTYDWIHQIWDKDHEQLYTQERYTLTVNMKPILVTEGEMLDSMTYSIKVDDMSTHSKLTSEYSSVNDIKIPDGYKKMDIKVSGYDAVYIYTEGKTEGNNNGIVSQAYNKGTIYVPIINALNDTGKIFTLEITCTMNGESFSLYDSMVGTYTGLIKNLPCTIDLEKEDKVFKKGAVVSNTDTVDSSADEEKSSPVVPIIAVATSLLGAAVAVNTYKKKKTVKVSEKTIVKTEKEIKHEKYVNKLKEKYGTDDEKELKKEIMGKQIYNEKLGYIAQKDMAWSDAALDTAEGAKKVADTSANMIGEFGGKKGKAFKHIYTGLTESAEAVGEIIAGKEASKAITEAVIDTSIGVIQNEANGLKEKYISNVTGGGAKEFAKTYMNTDGDVIKSIDAANEAMIEGAADAVFDSATDAIVSNAASKAVTDAGKEAIKETLEEGVNASKNMTQDLIKNSIKDSIKK